MISNYGAKAGGKVEMTHPAEHYICKVCNYILTFRNN